MTHSYRALDMGRRCGKFGLPVLLLCCYKNSAIFIAPAKCLEPPGEDDSWMVTKRRHSPASMLSHNLPLKLSMRP